MGAAGERHRPGSAARREHGVVVAVQCGQHRVPGRGRAEGGRCSREQFLGDAQSSVELAGRDEGDPLAASGPGNGAGPVRAHATDVGGQRGCRHALLPVARAVVRPEEDSARPGNYGPPAHRRRCGRERPADAFLQGCALLDREVADVRSGCLSQLGPGVHHEDGGVRDGVQRPARERGANRSASDDEQADVRGAHAPASDSKVRRLSACCLATMSNGSFFLFQCQPSHSVEM